MARRKELKSIASGIIGSFRSRNNDVDGYWGIGKLFKFAESNHVDEVKIDLLNCCITPATLEFDPLISHYKSLLVKNMASRHISLQWLSKATVTVLFNQEYVDKYHYWGSGLGKPCICHCELTDDKGRTYKVTTGTNCKPHNPEKEFKSNRVNDI